MAVDESSTVLVESGFEVAGVFDDEAAFAFVEVAAEEFVDAAVAAEAAGGEL